MYMNGGSLSSSAQSFDITVEKDVLALLQAVRGSALDEESKNEIRDLVFALRGQITQERVSELQMYLNPLQVAVVSGATLSAPTKLPVAQQSASGETPESAPVAISQSTPTPVATADATPVRVHQSVIGGRAIPQFGAPVAVAKTNTATPTQEAASPSTPEPIPEPVVEAHAEAPASTLSPPTIPTPLAPPTLPSVEATSEVQAPASPSSTDPAAAQARIAEIKRTVNEAVGNPVNLIDANNEVGREYMNALLEAMKSVNTSTNIGPAMARLETAFTVVQSTLKDAVRNTPPPAEEAAQPAPEPETSTVLPSVEAAAPTASTTNAWTTDEAAEAADATIAATTEVAPPAHSPTTEADTAVPAVDHTPLRSVAAAADEVTTKPPVSEVPKPTPSVDPLQSEAVTAGLQQLLTEWKLFKSTSLLGGGPKGETHPLYQELKNLPMNLVIAGRFEGATPEVKQSIHDYMNGWRYEQGMTHDLQETFEHYLRRVVKTIIDKQQKSS
jgi:hypothetical protein